MLNDVDIPLVSTIIPNGAVRASNVATITTSAAHNLQPGNIVQIQFVTDPTFNGTYTVQTVPSATTFTYNNTGSNTTSGTGAASLLIQGDWATDAVLLPFVNKAYRKVQNRLREAGSKTMTSEVTLAIAANAQSITDSTNPQLPATFLAPRELKERITGSGTQFYPMRPVDMLPTLATGSTIGYNGVFSWREDGIWFVGASNALDVLIRFFVGLLPVSDITSPLLIRGCLDAVASYTAYLAGLSRGYPTAQTFVAEFERDMKELLTMQAHARQYLPGRRQPNNRRRGHGIWGYGSTI